MINAIAFLLVGLLVGFLYGYLKRDTVKHNLMDRNEYLAKWEKRYREDAERWKNSYDALQRDITKQKLGYDLNASFIRMDNHHL